MDDMWKIPKVAYELLLEAEKPGVDNSTRRGMIQGVVGVIQWENETTEESAERIFKKWPESIQKAIMTFSSQTGSCKKDATAAMKPYYGVDTVDPE